MVINTNKSELTLIDHISEEIRNDTALMLHEVLPEQNFIMVLCAPLSESSIEPTSDEEIISQH